jgi:hypothetical protein
MDNVIFSNETTYTMASFEIEGLNSIEHYMQSSHSIQQAIELVIDEMMQTIFKYAKEMEFPQELLEELTDEEIDIFLLASYDVKYQNLLREKLFIINRDAHMSNYNYSTSNEIRTIEALGVGRMLVGKNIEGITVMESM